MTQAEIYQLLKKNKGKKFDTWQIAKALDMNIGPVRDNTEKLRRWHKDVKYEEFKIRVISYRYWIE